MTRTDLQYLIIFLKSFSMVFLPNGSCHFLLALVNAFFFDLYLNSLNDYRTVAVNCTLLQLDCIWFCRVPFAQVMDVAESGDKMNKCSHQMRGPYTVSIRAENKCSRHVSPWYLSLFHFQWMSSGCRTRYDQKTNHQIWLTQPNWIALFQGSENFIDLSH